MKIYMAYSADYRKAVIEYKRNGRTFKDLKEVFGITPHTYYQWVEILEETEMTKPEIARTRLGKIVNNPRTENVVLYQVVVKPS
jgi:transposase-like protein